MHQTNKVVPLLALYFLLAFTPALSRDQTVSPAYALKIAGRINKLVEDDFYDARIAHTAWPVAYQKLLAGLEKERPGSSNSFIDLDANINQALKSLASSHCQFVTSNDEAFFFLHSLFASLDPVAASKKNNSHSPLRPVACLGFVTGGCDFDADQIRYVLDGSPASRAGLLIGDRIKQVNKMPYSGFGDFVDGGSKNFQLKVERNHKEIVEMTVTAVIKEIYPLYVDALKQSKSEIISGKRRFGYLHLWAEGSASADALNEIIAGDMKDVDGLILDLRDGYGGASFQDLDLLYRPRAAFPDCLSKNKAGRTGSDRLYFDKPVVALINSGSRSGKELLAYGLKNSHRAILVGEKTAGAVLAGKLYPLDDQCALYLAVADISLGDPSKKSQTVRLEGLGVTPDIEVINNTHDAIGYGVQLKTAIEALEKQLAAQN